MGSGTGMKDNGADLHGNGTDLHGNVTAMKDNGAGMKDNGVSMKDNGASMKDNGAGEMDNGTTIRIMLVDDHQVVRSGLRAFLSVFDEFEFVGEASTGREALALCPQCKPDVILMDLLMPEMNGAEATREIRRLCPHVQVVVLTSFRKETLVEEALKAGAIGYLLKDVTADELAQAIHAAVKGKPTLSPEATQALIHASLHPNEQPPDLTDREEEVLKLMVAGDSNPEIARKLVVSLSTVKFHVSSILSKLGAASRTEAVSMALQEGWLQEGTRGIHR